jgi:pyrroloquinoline quinone biosynthesis protein D
MPASKITRDTLFTLGAHVSVQPMGDSTLVLLADSGQLFTCNETAEAFLAKVDGERRFADIVALFTTEFDIDEATAEADLTELAAMLLDEGVISAR